MKLERRLAEGQTVQVRPLRRYLLRYGGLRFGARKVTGPAVFVRYRFPGWHSSNYLLFHSRVTIRQGDQAVVDGTFGFGRRRQIVAHLQPGVQTEIEIYQTGHSGLWNAVRGQLEKRTLFSWNGYVTHNEVLAVLAGDVAWHPPKTIPAFVEVGPLRRRRG